MATQNRPTRDKHPWNREDHGWVKTTLMLLWCHANIAGTEMTTEWPKHQQLIYIFTVYQPRF